MASVDLKEVWFHDPDDLPNNVRVKAQTLERTARRRTERRVYAGGRMRTVSGPARPGDLRVQAAVVPRDVVEWLSKRLGWRLLVRDPRGLVMFGMVEDLPGSEVLFRDAVDVSFTVLELSGTVEV